jgi:hypothetical protein
MLIFVVNVLCHDRGSVLDSVLALGAAQVTLVQMQLSQATSLAIHIPAASDTSCGGAVSALLVIRAAAAAG